MNPSSGAADLVVGLDAGTSAIKVVVAECGSAGGPAVVGMGTAPSLGIKRGVVIHLDSVIASVTQALAEAELTAGTRIKVLDVAISGGQLGSLNSRGVVAVGRMRQVTEEDTHRAIEAARPLAIPEGREIIQAIPQDFVVDEQDGVADPIGMAGSRLEVNLHVITGHAASLLNLFACIRRCGVGVRDTVLSPLAAAESLLSEDEKNLGVAIVDVGAGTTSIAVFDRGALCHTAVVSMGGDHITHDLAVGLRTAPADAERLKRKYGRTFAISIDEGETIEIASIGGLSRRRIPRGLLTDIVATRVEMLLEAVGRELDSAGGGARLSAGVVLTGGGAAIRGLADTAATMLGLPVRRASPSATGCVADLVNTAAFSTAVGVVLCAARKRRDTAPAEPRPAGRLRTLLRALR